MRTWRVILLLTWLAACAVPPPVMTPVPLPHARHGHRVEPVRGGLLAFGGSAPRAGADASRQSWWLAPGAAAWRRVSDMATPRNFFGSAVIDGVVYAIGNGVERYDFDADRWCPVAPAGQLPRSHFAAAAIGRELFVLGGFPLERSTASLVDVDSGAVRATSAPPGFCAGDHFHCVATLAGELHVIGGLDGETFTPRCQHWIRDGASWRAAEPVPVGVWTKFGGSAVVGDELLLFGEFGGLCYDRASGWRPCAGRGELVAMAAYAGVGAEVCAIGGLPVEGPRRSMLGVYTPATDRWRSRDG
ncbi:MAG: hypothetical protein KDE27_26105 [Planctomycetes bacterium]|nr:hypothetical protein [Planctomycetota bacterium]